MQADFLDAHKRHWADAEYLFAAKRWANADHLYGMAAECGLKTLMQWLTNKPLDPKKDYVHVMEDRKAWNAWLRYQTYLSGHVDAIKFSLPPENPFSDWSASQRYAHQSNFDQMRAQSHQTGAMAVHELIKKAEIGGRI